MAENKWQGFESPEYHLQNLGRPAVFIIPVRALEKQVDGGTIADEVAIFLTEHFGAYTMTEIPSFGVWKGPGDQFVSDESRMYEVSFDGKENIPVLAAELARIARRTGEECIYLKAGQYSCLVYPTLAEQRAANQGQP